MEDEGDEIKSKQASKRDRTLSKEPNFLLNIKYYHCEIIRLNLNHYLQCTMATFVFRSCLKQCFNINDFPQPSGPTSKKGCLIPGSNQCKSVAIIPFTSEV